MVASGKWQMANEPANQQTNKLTNLLLKAIAVKQHIVQADPFEHGVRATLNLGHTFGHAIEQVSGYAVRHGEGVAMGLVCAGILSAKLGHCAPSFPEKIEAWVETVGLPPRIPKELDAEAIVAAMGSDKKKNAGNLRFILIREVGDAFVTGDVPLEMVLETVRACQH
jgi:3-dehydroquinate synthetase